MNYQIRGTVTGRISCKKKSRVDYSQLRWEMTMSQLRALAELLRVDVSDIPKNRKTELTNRLAEALGVK